MSPLPRRWYTVTSVVGSLTVVALLLAALVIAAPRGQLTDPQKGLLDRRSITAQAPGACVPHRAGWPIAPSPCEATAGLAGRLRTDPMGLEQRLVDEGNDISSRLGVVAAVGKSLAERFGQVGSSGWGYPQRARDSRLDMQAVRQSRVTWATCRGKTTGVDADATPCDSRLRWPEATFSKDAHQRENRRLLVAVRDPPACQVVR